MNIMRQTISVFSGNGWQGGYESYKGGEQLANAPYRIEKLAKFATSRNPDIIAFADMYGWNPNTQGGYFASEEQIANTFIEEGEARFTPLDDERLGKNGHPNLEAFGNLLVARSGILLESNEIDLGTRQATLHTVQLGEHAALFGHVYLDDMDENVRGGQIRALSSEVDKKLKNMFDRVDYHHNNRPVLLAGDFNALRPREYSNRTERMRKWAIGGLKKYTQFASHLPSSIAQKAPAVGQYMKTNESASAFIKSISGTQQAYALRELYAKGYKDADEILQRSTAPASPNLPIIGAPFGVDYMFYRDLDCLSVEVEDPNGASDHKALVGEFALKII